MLRLPTRCLVVLIGPSGAGKSTWAAAHFRPEQVVASDDLRAVVGESRFDQRAGSDAFDLLDRVLAARLGRRLLTVVDTLGLDADRRAAWVRAAHARGMPAIAVTFDTDAAVIRSRNKAAPRGVPDRVLARQIRVAAIVTPDLLAAEGFDRVEAPATDVTIVPPAFLPHPERTDHQHEEPPTLRFGLQIPRFDPPAAEQHGHLRDIAVAAEEAGFDSLWLMDHVVQIPQVGREWEDLLEAYTTLGFLAGVTERVRLGTLVTGVTYRNLALLGKQIATLDVLSGGRAIAGLGAAWFEREHLAYGYRFPDVPERYALLRDALELLPLMWGPGTPPFEGRTTSVTETICYPRPIQPHIPILIGGSGERTTLRLVAEHADACNLFGDVETVRHKIEVLRSHCADVGRDAAEVEVTTLGTVLAAPDRATLDQRVSDLTPADRAPETTAERVGAGTVDDQIIRFRAFADAGVDTAIINLPLYDVDRIGELALLIGALA
ncbi:MAG TPA: TIGR03560 family F420-dependent LLM class oxidoreductase [Euzebya sp.]|nr:TIGR03560 family F420-dependent LLM class oxidoreductase [Euzebya sp.]